MTEYQDKQWNILICNVSFCLFSLVEVQQYIHRKISDYVTEKPGKADVTVTLQIEKVISGKVEFELSQAMDENHDLCR